MSVTLDDPEHEKTIEERLQQLEMLMAAMVTGIALMNDLTKEELIEFSGD